MAVQSSLDHCGVVLVGRSQDGMAPGPQPQKGPTNATDCGSDPLLMAGGGQSRATGHQTLRIVHWNAEGVRQKNLELQQFLKAQKIYICCIQETHLNNTHRFSIRGYEIHWVDQADRPKGGVLTLVKTSIPSTEIQRSKKADTEYIIVKLILPDRNLTICNLYSPPNKAINLQILQPNSEDWMIVGDFNSHSPSWGYPSLDTKGEEVEHWIASNCVVLINTPTDPPTFYSRVWKTTSTPDIAIATDNIQKIAKREVSEQLGGSDHKPVILTLAKQVNTSAGKMPPNWNYKRADWKRLGELTDIYTQLITFSKHSVNKNASNFNSAVLKAAKESIPRGRRHDYKLYWNNTLEKIHKELSEFREEMERNPTPRNVRRHSQLKVDLDKEKQTQTQESWKTKTASLNMERDSQKLWQLTKSLNGDNSERGRITLQTTNGAVTGKAAANVLARVFEEESTASPSADRVKDVRTQTRAVLQNTATAGFDPCMTECLTLLELGRSAEKDEAEEGSRTWWNHKWNVETPRPWSKAYPTAHLQPKLVDRYCTNNLEGSCHKTHSKKGKRQTRSFQLPPDQSAQLCWKASGEDHQQKAHMASWVKLSSGFNTNRLSTIPKHRRPTGCLGAGHRRCLPREEEASGSFLWPVKGLRQSLERGAAAKASASRCTWQTVQVAQWFPLQ